MLSYACSLATEAVLLQEEMGEGMLQTCLYCQLPCETDMFTPEPAWCCSWCRAATHVRCYLDFHAHAAQTQKATADAKSQRGKRDKNEGGHTLQLPDFSLQDGKGPRSTSRKGSK